MGHHLVFDHIERGGIEREGVIAGCQSVRVAPHGNERPVQFSRNQGRTRIETPCDLDVLERRVPASEIALDSSSGAQQRRIVRRGLQCLRHLLFRLERGVRHPQVIACQRRMARRALGIQYQRPLGTQTGASRWVMYRRDR